MSILEHSISCKMTPRLIIVMTWMKAFFILEPLFWGNVIFKMCFFVSSHVWEREEFLWVAPPDCIIMLHSYVMNASLYSCWLRFTKQEQTLYPGKPNNGKYSVYVNCDFWARRAHLENDIASEKRPYNQNAFIKINDLGVVLLGKNAHNFFILSLVFLKLLIVSVAFFLGHPVLKKLSLYWKYQLIEHPCYLE